MNSIPTIIVVQITVWWGFFFFFIALELIVESMSLKYEPSSEPLHNWWSTWYRFWDLPTTAARHPGFGFRVSGLGRRAES
jgi:hypothetical protein